MLPTEHSSFATFSGSVWIIGFPDLGTPYAVLAPSTTPAFGVLPALSELRGFVLSSGGEHLYVANASKDTSQVLRFHASPGPGTTSKA